MKIHKIYLAVDLLSFMYYTVALWFWKLNSLGNLPEFHSLFTFSCFSVSVIGILNLTNYFISFPSLELLNFQDFLLSVFHVAEVEHILSMLFYLVINVRQIESSHLLVSTKCLQQAKLAGSWNSTQVFQVGSRNSNYCRAITCVPGSIFPGS